MGIQANGISLAEAVISSKIFDLVKEYRPDIVVITDMMHIFLKKMIKKI